MMDELLLGIDVGTTNCKALLFDLDGQAVASASAPTPAYHPRPGWTEHDPEALWQAVAGVIRAALAGIEPARVRGVAAASVSEAGVLLGSSGKPLAPIIAWHDSRTHEQQRRWIASFNQQRADTITCTPVRPIYSIFKLQWIREQTPEVYRAAAHWLHEADYIAYRLSGERATDFSLASRTLLFDLRGRRWSEELIAAAGLRGELLPPLMPAGQPLGAVTAAAAEATGLLPGTPVGVGGHDHIVGALGAGVVRAGQCLDSLGTAEAAFLPFDGLPPADPAIRGGTTFGAHVARGRSFVLEGLWSGGASVAWARQLLTPGAAGYEQIEALAGSAAPGSRGVLFLPRLAGGERGGFAGLTTASGPAELARAVYEGLAFGWRQLLERAERVLGLRAESIRVIGGGARSPIWLQIKANVLARPLRVLALEESVALGAAMLGGLAGGAYRDEAEALARVQPRERLVQPDLEESELYDRIYQAGFLHLMPALAELHLGMGRAWEGTGRPADREGA